MDYIKKYLSMGGCEPIALELLKEAEDEMKELHKKLYKVQINYAPLQQDELFTE